VVSILLLEVTLVRDRQMREFLDYGRIVTLGTNEEAMPQYGVAFLFWVTGAAFEAPERPRPGGHVRAVPFVDHARAILSM